MQQAPVYALAAQAEAEWPRRCAAGPVDGRLHLHACVRQRQTCKPVMSFKSAEIR